MQPTMSRTSRANVSRFQFQCPGLESAPVQVVAFTGTEAISRPFRYRLLLVSDRDGIGDGGVVGASAGLIVDRDGEPVPVQGMISHWERCGRSTDHVWYEVILRPRLWRLSLSTQSRVFQDVTVPAIIAEVLAGHGFAASDYRFLLGEQYPAREYCVQYQETDLQFVSRLLEFEGISYSFRHGPDGEVLTMTDDMRQYPSISAPDALRFASGAGMHRDRPEHVAVFTRRERLTPGRVILNDTDARQPETDLHVEAHVDGGADADVYMPDAKYSDVAEGRRLAQVRAEEEAARRTTYHGQSDVPALQAGHRFHLEGHDRPAFDREYLVAAVEHVGSQRRALGLSGRHPGGPRPDSFWAQQAAGLREHGDGDSGEDAVYRNQFRCQPAQIPFRPARITPVPRVPGLLSARVETSGGPYAALDGDGWYRARMAFDRSDSKPGHATKPIRMVTPNSGPEYGLHFPNHAGTEMIVGFLHGDVDRPVALGTVPNRTQKSPVTASNRMQNVLRTFGGSELRIDDTTGAEQILLRSPAGRELRLDDDRERSDLQTPSGHRLRLDDRGGAISVTTAAGQEVHLDDETKSIGVTSTAGHRIRIDDGTDRITVQDADGRHGIILDVAGDAIRLQTAGSLSLSAKDAVEITGRTVRIESEDGMTVESGSSLKQRARQGVDIEAGGTVSVEARHDLSLNGGGSASLEAPTVEVDAGQTLEGRAGAQVRLRGNDITIRGQSTADIQAALLKLNG